MKHYITPQFQVEYLLADTDTAVASPCPDCPTSTNCVDDDHWGDVIDFVLCSPGRPECPQ